MLLAINVCCVLPKIILRNMSLIHSHSEFLSSTFSKPHPNPGNSSHSNTLS